MIEERKVVKWSHATGKNIGCDGVKQEQKE
jgi:hypothetical protein